jgi:hypothetical protein
MDLFRRDCIERIDGTLTRSTHESSVQFIALIGFRCSRPVVTQHLASLVASDSQLGSTSKVKALIAEKEMKYWVDLQTSQRRTSQACLGVDVASHLIMA